MKKLKKSFAGNTAIIAKPGGTVQGNPRKRARPGVTGAALFLVFCNFYFPDVKYAADVTAS